jgi:pimeloyl-ACP methyl ester carboxylesterase
MKLKLAAMALLSAVTMASAQIVTPSNPVDGLARQAASGRTPTPAQKAVGDANVAELMREMKLAGVRQLRPPMNATRPDLPNYTNYDEKKANPYPLPDLLAFRNGKSVKTKADWLKRRAEIKQMFDEDVYGKYPAHIPKVTWHLDGTENLTVEGIPVVAKHLTGHVDNSSYPAISIDIKMDVVTPASARGHRVPVIIGGGALPRPNAPPRRMPSGMSIIMGPPTDSSAKQLLQKGWGFVSVNASQVQADNGAGLTSGIIGLVNKGQPRKMDDWGVLRAWAWADSRAMDYLVTDKDVDPKKVGVMGHSRGGKAALVALVDDPRFAIGFISSSGAGGANLYRRNYGELPSNLCAPNEFHWMAGNFLKYCAVGHTIDELPVDAHEFIALVAPRAVFIGGGGLIMEPASAIPGDAWQDAKGMFMAAAAASPAWTFYGRKGLPSATMPPMETLVDSGDVAFRQHPYGHTPNPNWSYFIQFAAKEFAEQK